MCHRLQMRRAGFLNFIFMRNRLQIANNDSVGNAIGTAPDGNSMVVEDQPEEEEVDGESEYAMDEV